MSDTLKAFAERIRAAAVAHGVTCITTIQAADAAVASMSASTTLAPALASERAIPSPMPEAAPVTIATLPSNLPIVSS